MSKKKRFAVTFVSAVFFHLGSSSIFSLGNLNVYIISLCHYSAQDFVNLQYAIMLVPLFMFSLTLFIPIIGPIELKLGPRATILMGSVALTLNLVLLYFVRNIWLTYVFYFTLGFGYGAVAMVPNKNCCFFYPQSKAIINAFLMGIMTSITLVYNLVGEKIINPDGKPLNAEGFYDKEVAEGVLLYYVILGGVLVVTGIIGQICFKKFENDEEKEERSTLPDIERDEEAENFEENLVEEDSINKKMEELKDVRKSVLEYNNINNSYAETNNEENDKATEVSYLNEQKSKTYKHDMKKVLKHHRIWMLAVISFCGTFSACYMSNTFRTFAPLTQNTESDAKFIQFMSVFNSLSLTIFTPIFGILFNKIGFKVCIKLLSVIGLANSCMLMLFLADKVIYRIFNCVSAVLNSGFMTIINPHVMNIYGIKYTLELNGIILVLQNVGSLLGGVASFVFGLFFKTGGELIVPYKIVFAVGSFFSAVAFVLQFFESNEEFKFSSRSASLDLNDKADESN